MSDIEQKDQELDKLSIVDFASELGSGSPAPGGGSTAALAGAMAAGLVSMVARITLNRTEDEQTRNTLESLIEASQESRKELLKLINDDTAAFNAIMESYQLPKGSGSEKRARSEAIQAATKLAAEVPLSTAKLGLKTLGWVRNLTDIGSEQAITDTGVAGLMAYSAIMGAVWNVKINLSSIKDEPFKQRINSELAEINSTLQVLWPEILTKIEKKV